MTAVVSLIGEIGDKRSSVNVKLKTLNLNTPSPHSRTCHGKC